MGEKGLSSRKEDTEGQNPASLAAGGALHMALLGRVKSTVSCRASNHPSEDKQLGRCAPVIWWPFKTNSGHLENSSRPAP